jgi:FKBP-type peptidyl-prolyl cis-trans isomerase FklB
MTFHQKIGMQQLIHHHMTMMQWFLVLLLLASTSSVVRGSNEEGLAFLEENKDKPGVVTLPSGLQYKVLRSGDGLYHPSVSSPCLCHYGGTLIDGTTFDSSYDRGEPTTFAPNQVIKGWTEAMQLMVEGDQWELYIPSELAYGERGSPPKIPGDSVLIFRIEILKINDDESNLPMAMKCNVTTKEHCSEKDIAYLEKSQAWTADKTTTELQRLEKMVADAASFGKLKADLRGWIQRRTKLLQLLQDAASNTEEAPEL